MRKKKVLIENTILKSFNKIISIERNNITKKKKEIFWH